MLPADPRCEPVPLWVRLRQGRAVSLSARPAAALPSADQRTDPRPHRHHPDRRAGVARADAVDDGERRARIWLSGVFEPGDPVAAKLLTQFPASAVLERILAAAVDEQTRFADWKARAQQVDDERLLVAAAAVGARYACPGDP